MAKKIRVWDGTAWQDVAPSLPYTAIHSAQASMPATGVDGQVWLDTDGTLAAQDFVPLSGGTMTGNLNTPSINAGGISGKNYAINGNFDFWQRGTSFTTDSAATWIYTADRWAAQNLYSGAGAVNVVTQETIHVPAGSKYSIKSVVGTASVVNNGRMNLLYTFEHQDAIDLAGKVITISAQVKAIGAVDRYNIAGYYSTSGGKAHAGTAYISGNTSVINSSGFTKVSATFTVPSASTLTSTGTLGIRFVFYKNNGVPESVGDGIYISQVKIEEGSTATTFSTAEPTMAGELAACQRYYYRINDASASSWPVFGFGWANTTGNLIIHSNFPVKMRTKPSSIDISGMSTYSWEFSNQGGNTATSITLDNNYSSQESGVINVVKSSAFTVNQQYRLNGNANNTAYLGFSAEL